MIIANINFFNFFDVKKDSEFEPPFIQVLGSDERLVRIYPSAHNTKFTSSSILNLDVISQLMGKQIRYQDFSGYVFGRIDHYVDDGVYEVFNKFNNKVCTIYEDKIVIGFSCAYLDSKVIEGNNSTNQYLLKEVNKIQGFIGTNFSVESDQNSKNFIVEKDNRTYIFTIVANDVDGKTIYDIIKTNREFMLKISMFLDYNSYKRSIYPEGN